MYRSVKSFRSRLHLDGYVTMPLIKVYMRWIDYCNHDIFAYLNIISFHEKKRNGSLHKIKSFFYEVQIEIPLYLICYEIDHRSIPFLFGSIDYTPILSFMLLFPSDMSGPGHPNWIDWDDSFSFRVCKIRISIKSHIAVY